MLSNKEISQRFEVQVSTLYNWKKTKPKLYKYLQNADYNSDRNEEINVLLEQYLHSIDRHFTKEEIEYIARSSMELTSIEEVKHFHKEFMKVEYKNIPSNGELILSVYDKLAQMNIIEKYILYKKVYKYRKADGDLALEELFAHYLAD